LFGELPGLVFYIIPNKGFALLMIKQEASDIYLSNLLISEEYRGMGIGSAFIAWLKNFRDQYYPGFSISLSCLNKNLAAQAFYESHGFVPVKRDSWATTYSNMPDNSFSLQLQNFSCITK
jgi:ribosomal protein S18 acetylase RimI-like enzyme